MIEMVVIIDDSETTIASQGNYNRETAAIAIDASLPTGSKTGIVRISGDFSTVVRGSPAKPHMFGSGYLDITLQSFLPVTQTGQPSDLAQAISGAERHFSNNINTAKFIVLLSDGMSSTGISECYFSYLKDKQIKIMPFAIGNNSNGINYLKSLAYHTGGTFYRLENYSAFTSEYSTLINIDIDSDSDGLPDYYESNIPIYNGGYMMTNTALRDTDGDSLADGEEILISRQYIPMTNNVRVTAVMHSDPRKEDSDDDGIEDFDDTAPFSKGLAGGIVGELSIVSYADPPDQLGGHSFLIYHSFVNDILNVSKLKGGYKADKKNNGAINWIRSSDSYYSIERGHYITFGAMTDSSAGALLNSIPDNLSSLLDNRATEGGVYYNEEANSLLAEGNLHCDYQPNLCLSSNLTDTQLSQLLNYLGDNNYYNLMYHNCSTVASGAWNCLFNESLNARITSVHYNIASITGMTIISFDAPLMLMVDMSGRSSMTYCFNDLINRFSEERGLL